MQVDRGRSGLVQGIEAKRARNGSARDERRGAIEAAVDEASGHVPVVAGTGALGTDDAVKLAQDAKAIGAAAGLLSAASYTPVAEEEVFEHFRTVAVESGPSHRQRSRPLPHDGDLR